MGENKEQHLLFTGVMLGIGLFNFALSCQTTCHPDKLMFCLIPFCFQYFAVGHWLRNDPKFRAALLQGKEQPKIMAALLPLLCLGLDAAIVFNLVQNPASLFCVALFLTAVGLWQEWKNGFLLGRRLLSRKALTSA